MKLKSSVFCVLVLVSVYLTPVCSIGNDDLSMTYKQFKNLYEKAELIPDQQSQRQTIFYQNIQILKTKIQNGCSACGVTKFFDQTSEEFRSRMGLLSQQHQQTDTLQPSAVKTSSTAHQISNQNLIKVGDVPSSKNWADQGKITSIKNQGSCGTCWSFATAAAIESSLILKGEASNYFFYQPDLSEQYLLTCASTGTCKGGYLQEAIDLAYLKGIPYESDLPYQAQKGDQGICSSTRGNVKYTDGSKARFSYYNIGDSQIINLLQQGPVMVAVSADDWEYYGGGTFSCKSTAQVNHAVLLVGYDRDKWIIKNQWGTNWGEKGFIYVTRNSLTNCKIGTAVHQLSTSSIFFSGLLLIITLFVLL